MCQDVAYQSLGKMRYDTQKGALHVVLAGPCSLPLSRTIHKLCTISLFYLGSGLCDKLGWWGFGVYDSPHFCKYD